MPGSQIKLNNNGLKLLGAVAVASFVNALLIFNVVNYLVILLIVAHIPGLLLGIFTFWFVKIEVGTRGAIMWLLATSFSYLIAYYSIKVYDPLPVLGSLGFVTSGVIGAFILALWYRTYYKISGFGVLLSIVIGGMMVFLVQKLMLNDPGSSFNFTELLSWLEESINFLAVLHLVWPLSVIGLLHSMRRTK